jgi:hypothetical protein
MGRKTAFFSAGILFTYYNKSALERLGRHGTFNPSLHEFPKKHDKNNLPAKIHPETQQILHKNNFIDDFPNFNENLCMYHI